MSENPITNPPTNVAHGLGAIRAWSVSLYLEENYLLPVESYLAPAADAAVGSDSVSILSQFTTGASFSFTMQTSKPSPPLTRSGVPTDSKLSASMNSLSGPPESS